MSRFLADDVICTTVSIDPVQSIAVLSNGSVRSAPSLRLLLKTRAKQGTWPPCPLKAK